MLGSHIQPLNLANLRAFSVVLLVPLMRDFQRRLNNHAVRKFQDEMMHHAALAAAEYRTAEHQ